MIRASSLVCALAVAAGGAWADDFRVRTELGFASLATGSASLNQALGYQDVQGGTGSIRLMYDGGNGPWRYELHGAIGYAAGDRVALAGAFPATGAPPTLFDLSYRWLDETDRLGSADIDRAWISYTTDSLVVKAGRQAITWGTGRVFHPSDFVAPFAPVAVDTSFKPGADMVYLQYLLDSGADIQAIAVPRAATYGGTVSMDHSTYAVRAAGTLGPLDAAFSFGLDHGDRVAALGLGGPIGGASWNAEYVSWMLDTGETVPSWLVNLTAFGTLGNWNAVYFGEYFHNGFGADASVPLDALPADLAKRMAANQVFFPGTDFLALGTSLQITPEFSASPSVIISLDDGSALAGFASGYSLNDTTDISVNISKVIGGHGTEFGGRETSAGSGIYAEPGTSVELRLVRYF